MQAATGAARGLALTIASLAGARVVVPRAFTLSIEPGEGSLRLPDEERMDPACVASLRHAWDAAREVCGAPGVAGEARFTGSATIQGGSAGIILALHAAFLLRGARLPADVLATGAVGPGGRFVGGSAVAEKAAGLAAVLRPLGLASARLVCPLLPVVPFVPSVRITPAAGLAEALHLLGAEPGAPPMASATAGRQAPMPPRDASAKPFRYF